MTNDEALHFCDQYAEVLKGYFEAHEEVFSVCSQIYPNPIEDLIEERATREWDPVRETIFFELGFLQSACAVLGIYSMTELLEQVTRGSVI
jgi:hypothetical protein